MKNSLPPSRQSAANALRRHLTCAALAFGLTGLLSQTVQAQFALPFYEPFPANYTNGGSVITVNGVDWVGRAIRDSSAPQGTVWTWGGAGTGNQMVTGGAALSYAGLWQASGSVGLFMRTDHVTGNRNAGVTLATLDSGKVYTSFLLNVQSWPTNQNRMVCQLNSLSTTLGGSELVSFFISTTNTTTGTSNRLYVVKHSSSVTNEPPAEAPSIDAGTTHLIVIRYTFNPALTNDDELAMWVDPASLGVPEGNVPAPVTTTTNGTDVISFGTFAICAQNDTAIAGSSVFLDEIRIGRTWVDVTPTVAPCTTVSLISSPTNLSVVEGGMAVFNTTAAGTSPTYQWQVSTDNGATWNPASAPAGFNTNAASFTIPVVTLAHNNNKYRCQIAVACDNSVTNSEAATLTVTAPTITPPGVIVDDFFMKRDRLSGPVNGTNSQWFTDITASLYENAEPDPFMLVGLPQDGSCMWHGYFVDTGAQPVHLDVGRVLKASLVFTCQGIASGTNSGLRIGLFDHYDAGVRLTGDGNGVKTAPNGAANRGYAFYQNWDTVFSDDEPQTVYARNNLSDATVLGTIGNYYTLRHSAAGFSNAPAFSSGTTYTMDLYVARMTTGRCSVCMNVSGGGTNYTTTAADRDYGYHRFDSIALRPNNVYTTANEFDFSEFKVEVLPLPDRPTLNIAPSGSNVVLSWTNPAIYMPFQLQQASAVTGPWTIIPGGDTSPYTVPTTNSATFFRLEWP